MQLQSTRTKALADTLDISDGKKRSETVKKVNSIGKHLISDLNIPRWTENEDPVLKFIQAIVAVSEPTITANKGMDHEFETSLTSEPLLDLKRSKRHQKAHELLERYPMIVVPKD